MLVPFYVYNRIWRRSDNRWSFKRHRTIYQILKKI